MTRPRIVAVTFLGPLVVGAFGCSLFVNLDGYAGSLGSDASPEASEAEASDASDGGHVDAPGDAPSEQVGDAPGETRDAPGVDTGDAGGGEAGCGPDGTSCGDGGVCVGGKCGSCTTKFEPPQAAEPMFPSNAAWFCNGNTNVACSGTPLLDAVLAKDGNEAESQLGSGSQAFTQSIDATGFFSGSTSIPSGSLIQGIQVRIYKWASGTQLVFDSVVQLINGGTGTIGTNMAMTGTAWPATDDVTNYGCANCTWSVAGGLTYADVTAQSFGVRVIAKNTSSTPTAYVDSIAMGITYCH
jgi:hypothetical protein